MNLFLLINLLISAPWQFGVEAGWAAGLYAWPAEDDHYINPNAGTQVNTSRPAIPLPGYAHLGFSLEPQASIGYGLDLDFHYKTYHVTGKVGNIPYMRLLTFTLNEDVPYVHFSAGAGLQKTLKLSNGKVLFPLGIQLTYNYFIPVLTQELLNIYAEKLTKETLTGATDILKWTQDPKLIVDYIDEHKMGMRIKTGFGLALYKTPTFTWSLEAKLDWNVLFGANQNKLLFYPEFGLLTGFRF